MNKILKLNLDELLTSKEDDSISGRKTGQAYLKDKKVITSLEDGYKIEIIIDERINAINDSFWKGFFSGVMEKYKSKEEIMKHFQIIGDEYFIDSVDKNLMILESIFKSEK
jgi:hypothetical protein